MKKYFTILTLVLILLLFEQNFSQERADIIVTKDGRGNFTPIQEALN